MLATAAAAAIPHASATSVSYDEVLFQESINEALLSASIDMTVSGSQLSIVLRNTSPGGAWDGDSAASLLTGLGFNLPSGVGIASGSASIAGYTPVNFPGSFTGSDVSSEWGYNQGTIGSGHFNGSLGSSAVNAVVSSMGTDAASRFATGSIDNGSGLNGPDFGLISSGLAGSGFSGQEASMDGITLTLNLTGTIPTDLIAQIDAHPVVLTFGSPSTLRLPPSESVPDTGSSLALLGAATTALGAVQVRRARRN